MSRQSSEHLWHTSSTIVPASMHKGMHRSFSMQFNELNVVNGAPSMDASTVGHVLSVLKQCKGY